MNTPSGNMRAGWVRRTTMLSIVLVVAICWWWIIQLARDMYGPMTGASAWMMTSSWDWSHVTLLFMMWSAMMVAMMVPTAAPTLWRCAPVVHIGAIVAGYIFVWTLFSLAATVAQRLMSAASLLTPMMEPSMPIVAGGLLVIAGVYQLLPFKRTCLASCRMSTAGIACLEPSPTRIVAAFRSGTRHGLTCLGCCWALMLLLFAGGVMNLAVITTLTAIVLFEKLAPFGMSSTLISGGALIGLGVWTIAR
jgi:predicted metal-binding membrane protein